MCRESVEDFCNWTTPFSLFRFPYSDICQSFLFQNLATFCHINFICFFTIIKKKCLRLYFSGKIIPSGVAADSYKKAVESAIANLKNLEATNSNIGEVIKAATELPSWVSFV